MSCQEISCDDEQMIRDLCHFGNEKEKQARKKHTKSSETNLEASTSKQIPKKRGRPKKQVLDNPVAKERVSRTAEKLNKIRKIEEENNILEREQKIDESKDGKVQESDELQGKESGSGTVKRKRGRPPKNRNIESNISENELKIKRTKKQRVADSEHKNEMNEATYSPSGYATKSGRIVNRHSSTEDPILSTSAASDTGCEDKSHWDISKLNNEDKKLYEKHKEKADIWIKEFNSGSVKCPWCAMKSKKLKTLLRHYDKCTDYYKDGFKCSECGKVFNSPSSLKYHKLSSHISKAVEEYKNKDGTKQCETTVLKQILRHKKKLSCDTCVKSFTTVNGYQYHKKKCGADTEREVYTCTLCDKIYSSQGGLKYHQNSVHSSGPEEEESEEVETVSEATDDAGTDSSGRRRRSAAHKALNSMKELKEKGFVEIKDTEKDDKIKNSKYDFQLFTAPTIVIEEDMLGKWKSLFSLKQRVNCPFNCNFSTLVLGALKDHYNSCKKNPNFEILEPYRCKLCSKEYTSRSSIVSHVRLTHTQEERQKYFTENNIVESGSSESEDDDEEDEEEEEEEEVEDHSVELSDDEEDEESANIKNTLLAKINEVKVKVNVDERKKRRPGRFSTTLNSIDHFYKWKKSNHCKLGQRLFQESNQQLNKWKVLSASDAAKVEPQCQLSPRFMVRVDKGNSDIQSVTYDENEEVFRLESYGILPETSDKNGPYTMFVGGPVWAMAWCPTPFKQDSANQYAAISCHQSYDSTHKSSSRYEYSGVIQIWNFGCLSKNRKSNPPHLAYGLVHNCGAIWQLKWCPSGCWDDPADIQDCSVSRLGVFAVSCSNSTVCVFSVAHEEALTDARTKVKPAFYHVQPTLILKPASLAADWSAIGQCWCLDWLPSQPHNQIAAGFSNGMIAIWNLTTSSPLLKEHGCSTSPPSLYPYRSFIAHANLVSGISWCPTDPYFLGSVSSDNKMSLWNLQDTSQPMVVREKQSPVSCHWTVHNKGIVSCRDAMIGGPSVNFQDLGAFGLKSQTVIRKETCMLASDKNDWLDSVVVGDVFGDVRCQGLRMGRKIYHTFPHMWSVYQTTIIDLNKVNGKSLNGHPKPEGNVAQQDVKAVENDDLARAYDNAILIFHDALMSPCRFLPAIVERLNKQDKSEFKFQKRFLASIQRASWNPNLREVGWVLTGGQSGLVRAHCVKDLFQDAVQAQIKKILRNVET